MTDIGATVAPRSDQLNSDDLITGPKTITVTRVTANPGADAQPVAIYYEGDGGKPYMPCKSMRRVLIQVWGVDGNSFAGKSMTLYRDPDVVFGGLKVGGIRISHMTGLENPVTLVLTASKAKRAPYTVQPLKLAAKVATVPEASIEDVRAYQGVVDVVLAKATDATALGTWWNSAEEKAARKGLPAPVIKNLVAEVTAKITELKNAGNSASETTE